MDALCVPFFVLTVGTERVCQITVVSASQHRAYVLLAYVEGRWFPPQNLSVLSVPCACIVCAILRTNGRFRAWVPTNGVSASQYRACVPTNGGVCQSVPSVCAACICRGMLVSTAELVGTERVCQLTAVSTSTGQNLWVLSFFALTCQHLSAPSVCAACVCGRTVVSTAELVGTERSM